MFSLVSVDGSENSHRALNTAVFLSTRTELQLTALNVMENFPTVYLQSPKISKDLLDSYKNQSQAILEKCKNIANKNKKRNSNCAYGMDTYGDAAHKIIQYSQKENFDTIIIGH